MKRVSFILSLFLFSQISLHTQGISLSAESWRFSGKEEFDDSFGLPQSDFGARFYDRTAYPNRNPAYLNGAYIHRNNRDEFTGIFYSKKKQRIAGISEGCLIISSKHWGEFHNQLTGINTYKILINRK